MKGKLFLEFHKHFRFLFWGAFFTRFFIFVCCETRHKSRLERLRTLVRCEEVNRHIFTGADWKKVYIVTRKINVQTIIRLIGDVLCLSMWMPYQLWLCFSTLFLHPQTHTRKLKFTPHILTAHAKSIIYCEAKQRRRHLEGSCWSFNSFTSHPIALTFISDSIPP